MFPRRKPLALVWLVCLAPGADPQQIAAAMKSSLPNDVRVLTHAEFIQFEEN